MKKKGKEFSKFLLVQESVIIWVITLSFIALAYRAMDTGYIGSLPWLAAFPTVAWGAYGISQSMYYKKSAQENTKGGVIYETAMLAATHATDPEPGENFEMPDVPNVISSSIDLFGPI